MKIFIPLLISFLISLNINAAPHEHTVKLRIGETRSADHGRVNIRFISVLEDSRCPMNARCVWAGNAKIKVAVSVGRRRAVTVELNSTTKPQTVTIQGYRLSLQDLNPQKGQPADWPKRPIRATVSVEKV